MAICPSLLKLLFEKPPSLESLAPGDDEAVALSDIRESVAEVILGDGAELEDDKVAWEGTR